MFDRTELDKELSQVKNPREKEIYELAYIRGHNFGLRNVLTKIRKVNEPMRKNYLKED